MIINNKLDLLLNKVVKPGRYIGGELNTVEKSNYKCHFGFAFPDTYEIGMSYLGLQILYRILNDQHDIYCERLFAPAPDMESLMREEGLSLFTIETKTPASELDIIGFTLQYEMSYTNIINMLDLAKVPFLSKDRGDEWPLLIAGGPCAYNPEPLADVFDAFIIGDGEEQILQFCNAYIKNSETNGTKEDFLKSVCQLDGVYVPRFYDPIYQEDGTIKEIQKNFKGAPDIIRRALISDIETAAFPENPIVPLIETVHDRSVVETFRGCTRGCRFCQAGMIYRPLRERSKEKIIDLAIKQLDSSGHDELSLLSLSTSDYSCFEPLVMELMTICKERNVSLSLPSLRLDSFSFKVLQEIQGYRKSGLTFAPEAGTQRLRDVINKGITDEDIYGSIRKALELGWNNIKLYFMIGLPTETYSDLDGIIEIAKKIVRINYDIKGPRGGRFNVTISVSNFVPKADTPFQWESQDAPEELIKKHNYLKDGLRMKHITFNYHDSATSFLEGVFARGDRKVLKAIIRAFELGARFDGWSEHFKADIWIQAFKDANIDPYFYNTRRRDYEEILPWDIIDCGVTKDFLISESKKSNFGMITNDCRINCEDCGLSRYTICKLEGINGKISDNIH